MITIIKLHLRNLNKSYNEDQTFKINQILALNNLQRVDMPLNK